MSDSSPSSTLDRRGFCACALGAAGALSVASLGCGGGGSDPAPSGGNNGGGGGGGGTTLTTTESKSSMLAQSNGTAHHYGSSVTCPGVAGTPQGVYLVRDADGIYAVSASCTHLGGLVAPNGSGGFTCPCHGSQYTLNGVPTQGPAAANLPHYLVSEETAGGMLQINTASTVSASTRLT